MLREIPNPRQIPGEPPRRWFHSPDMDLVVWLGGADTDDALCAFQLCYDKSFGEKALYWSAGQGFTHMNVDDGEDHPGKHKATPLLVPHGACDGHMLRRRFAATAQALPESIRRFVEARLTLASQRPDHPANRSPGKPC